MNKSNLTNWLTALCATLLIVLLVLQIKQKSQLEALRREHDAFVSATEQQQKEQRAERETNFREMRQQLDDLVNSGALFPDKSKPALEAVALAKAAEQAGDTNLAKIYYLSAVNHAPSEFSYLKNYADIVFRDPAVTTEDFDRLKSVLQISLYQIPPASVTNALALLSETEQRENQLIAAQTPKPVPVNWQEQFDQITKAFPLDTTWSDLKKISKRWEGLNQIAESLREEPSQTNLLEQVENEADLTQNVLTASRLAQVMDTILQSLDSSVEQPEKAVSMLQTAEAALGQLWGIDFKIPGWPKALSDKVDAYPKTIQNYVEKVAEVKSRPFVNQIRDALAEANSYKIEQAGNKYQKAWEHYDHCMTNVNAATVNISSIAGRRVADAARQEIGNLAVSVKRQQFDAYQKWAVSACSGAFNTYNGPKDGWFSAKWKGAFDNTDLTDVDQGVLAPETARLFDEIVQKFYAAMNGWDQFQMKKELATDRKKKLEDF
jgi:hypothetical protein